MSDTATKKEFNLSLITAMFGTDAVVPVKITVTAKNTTLTKDGLSTTLPVSEVAGQKLEVGSYEMLVGAEAVTIKEVASPVKQSCTSMQRLD